MYFYQITMTRNDQPMRFCGVVYAKDERSAANKVHDKYTSDIPMDNTKISDVSLTYTSSDCMDMGEIKKFFNK